MNKSDIEQAKTRLSMWKDKLREIEHRKANNGGMLKRQEWWEREYFETPYLTFASNDYLEQRFFDHFHNQLRLTAEGKIAPRPDFADGGGLIAPLFSHMMLEFGARGLGLPVVNEKAFRQLDKYFEDGEPTGVQLFRGLPETLDDVIVKFGKRQHLKPMLEHGKLRLSPAEFYQSSGLVEAMKDQETERWFHDPQFDLILAGKSNFKIKGVDTKIQDGFLKFSINCPNYLLWSACKDIDRRLPDDFCADAAIIIRNPLIFSSRLKQEATRIWPKSPTWCGDVKYYDPCSFADIKRRPETIKHFSYLYQREWRFCAFPDEDMMPKEPLEISIGSIKDIADLVTL
jgi:hypothetical protein